MTAQVIVLGMHRSGTSLVSKLIEAMGYYIGKSEDFLPENAGNPRGYWERKDIVELNKMLMSAQNTNWWNPQSFDVECIAEDVRQLFGKSARETIDLLNQAGNFAIKDPRFVVTLDEWISLLKSPFCVLCIRHPLDVATSLQERNGIPLQVGLALWHWYNTKLLQVTADRDAVIIDYQELLHAPEAQLRRLESRLPGAILKPEALKYALDSVIDFSLSKPKVSTHAERNVPKNQLDLYYRMLAGDRDYQSDFLDSSVQVLELYRKSRDLSDEIKRIKKDAEGQIGGLQQSLEDQKNKVERYSLKSKDLNGEIERIKKSTERQIGGLQQSLEDQKNKVKKYSLKSKSLNGEIKRIKKSTERQIGALQQSLEDQENKVERYSLKSKDLNGEIERIRKSTERQIGALQQSLEDQKNKTERYSLKSRDLNGEIERIKKNTEHQIAALQQSLEDQKNEVEKYSLKSKGLSEELERIKRNAERQIEALQKSLENQKSKVKKHSQSIEGYKKSLASSNDGLTVLRKKNSTFQTKIKTKELESEKLRDQVLEKAGEIKALREKSRKNSTNLRKKMKVEKSLNEDLRRQALEKEEEVGTLRAECEAHEGFRNQLEKQLEAEQSARRKLAKKKTALQKSLTLLKAQSVEQLEIISKLKMEIGSSQGKSSIDKSNGDE